MFNKRQILKASMLSLLIGGAMSISSAEAATLKRVNFGTLANGEKVEKITLSNGKITADIITYGATLQNLLVPDRNGKVEDITLGYDTLAGYVETPQYLGVTVGRYANRIDDGRFTLDGKEYTLVKNNNGTTSLHGGPVGFDKRNWTIINTSANASKASATFMLKAKDMEEGFPGNMDIEVTYTLNSNNDLIVSYKATTDKPTVVNLTNHALYNLGGVPAKRSALDATLKLEADTYLPINSKSIPTGEIKSVKNSPFDFTKPAKISHRVNNGNDEQIMIGLGIDHNFLVRGGVTKEPKLAVTLTDAVTGRGMKISTTEPGMQMYTGNFLDGKIKGKGGYVTRMGDGVAFEAQKYPDTPNRPEFPSARLNPGETYTQTTVHHFYTIK